MSRPATNARDIEMRILRVKTSSELGNFRSLPGEEASLDEWEVGTAPEETISQLREVASYLRTSDIPVAFPTETVYGLGADATRSGAVRGIYTAKGRPSDNPLIVHVSDLTMLRGLLTPDGVTNGAAARADPIPAIYQPLIKRYWPGPLTILLPNPKPSRLAPEVTAGLPTFGARMPASSLARTLISLAGTPLAAPSANASTRPSPTTAAHVAEDLAGRIELIVDGGPCGVGVESTVVDGLCDPPVVLRPGGLGIDDIRSVPGWETVTRAYKDESEVGGNGAPRAPGMKYKHYSPKARVLLYEDGCKSLPLADVVQALTGRESNTKQSIGIIRTGHWPAAGGLRTTSDLTVLDDLSHVEDDDDTSVYTVRQADLLDEHVTVLDLDLGMDIKGIAQGLFAALRELDRHGASVIFIEGVSDGDDIAAAVMNRLRKAASEIRS
jgi:L-threonylcarbamoyladenylate synthase